LFRRAWARSGQWQGKQVARHLAALEEGNSSHPQHFQRHLDSTANGNGHADAIGVLAEAGLIALLTLQSFVGHCVERHVRLEAIK